MIEDEYVMPEFVEGLTFPSVENKTQAGAVNVKVRCSTVCVPETGWSLARESYVETFGSMRVSATGPFHVADGVGLTTQK